MTCMKMRVQRKPCPECGKLLTNVPEHVKSVHLQVIRLLFKGCKKRVPPQKWRLNSQFLHFIHATPITGKGILSGFQIILKNFYETCSFLFMMKNAPKGRFFK